VLVRPDVSEWPRLVEANRSATAGWTFDVGGAPAPFLRETARGEALAAAEKFSTRLGVKIAPAGPPDAPVVMTGHQPELYHPGIWVKDFLVQRLAGELDGTGVDLVVDTDSFNTIEVASPCLEPEVRRCRHQLAEGKKDGCYASSPVPRPGDLEEFCADVARDLATLPAPAVRRHFDAFCEHLHVAAESAENVAELVTFARRRYEAEARTDYLELPVSSLSQGSAFMRLVVHLSRDARRFAEVYNSELEQFRVVSGARSAAQPFPDLDVRDGGVELPMWYLDGGDRLPVQAREHGDDVSLTVGDTELLAVPSNSDEAVEAVAILPGTLVPKALLLTLFARLFVADLFVHGVGGGRYDQVTDGVIRRYFGVEPPGFAVASMTMYLPLGVRAVSDEEIARASERGNRFLHNPDALLDEVEFDSATERHRAYALASEKKTLLGEIALPGADKKALGSRIRDVNEALRELLKPFGLEVEADKQRLEAQREASEILTDRTYPFCFWSPEEVADKVR
jgi:hypothetical protein